jgi:hypothetical protein
MGYQPVEYARYMCIFDFSAPVTEAAAHRFISLVWGAGGSVHCTGVRPVEYTGYDDIESHTKTRCVLNEQFYGAAARMSNALDGKDKDA